MSNQINQNTDNRRPLKVRQVTIMAACARWLSHRQITPNQISIASVGFALLAAVCIVLIPATHTAAWLPAIGAAVLIQGRLLCNLFDGMVAVEGGKSTPSGELFNDIPDRVADPIILVAAGYAIGDISWSISLGWCAGLLAVMTAYIRTLAASIDAPVNFQGPMAKQHRMAVMTAACLLCAVESLFWSTQLSLVCALIIISVGCLITAIRRTVTAYRFLESQSPQSESE